MEFGFTSKKRLGITSQFHALTRDTSDRLRDDNFVIARNVCVIRVHPSFLLKISKQTNKQTNKNFMVASSGPNEVVKVVKSSVVRRN